MNKFIIFLIVSFFGISTMNISSTESQTQISSTFHVDLAKYPTYHYPYPHLAEKLTKEGQNSLPLFGYGSLVDKTSAARTLSQEAISTRRPALAFGVKRTFDRDVPITISSKWGIPCKENARGMLNVQPTDDLGVFINGVILNVPLKDIPALLDREVGYDLIPVVVADWNAFVLGKMDFSIAYILSTPSDSSYVSHSILPRPGYYELSRDAAKQYGETFAQIWMNTTYLGDGKTLVATWEKLVLNKDSSTIVCKKSDGS